MDAETKNKRIVDLSDAELTALGFLGETAPPRTVRVIEAIKAHPDEMGYVTCFMVNCVREQKRYRSPARIVRLSST